MSRSKSCLPPGGISLGIGIAFLSERHRSPRPQPPPQPPPEPSPAPPPRPPTPPPTSTPSHPILLIPGVAGSILCMTPTDPPPPPSPSASDPSTDADKPHMGERCWIRFNGANAAAQRGLVGRFDAATSTTQGLHAGVETFVPRPTRDQDPGFLYPIDTLDPDLRLPIRGVEYFRKFIAFLESTGYERGATLFGFGYDYRQSLRLEAHQKGLMERIREASRCAHGAKVDVVSHSMGGLLMASVLAAYPEDCAALVNSWTAVACPFQGGGAFALNAFVDGVQWAHGLASLFFVSREVMRQVVLQSPSVYELLPHSALRDAQGAAACVRVWWSPEALGMSSAKQAASAHEYESVGGNVRTAGAATTQTSEASVSAAAESSQTGSGIGRIRPFESESERPQAICVTYRVDPDDESDGSGGPPATASTSTSAALVPVRASKVPVPVRRRLLRLERSEDMFALPSPLLPSGICDACDLTESESGLQLQLTAEGEIRVGEGENLKPVSRRVLGGALKLSEVPESAAEDDVFETPGHTPGSLRASRSDSDLESRPYSSLLKTLLENNSVEVDGWDVLLPFNEALWGFTGETRRRLAPPPSLPPGIKFYSIYGTGSATPFSAAYGSAERPVASLEELTGAQAAVVYSLEDGDGVVPAASAAADGLGERAAARLAVPGGTHRGLMEDAEVFATIGRWLRESEAGPGAEH